MKTFTALQMWLAFGGGLFLGGLGGLLILALLQVAQERRYERDLRRLQDRGPEA